MPSGQQVVCPPSPGLREEALLHPVGSQCQPVLGREGGGWGGTLRAFRPVVRAARVRGSERPRAEPAFAFSRRGAWAPRSLNQPHGGPMGPLAASGLLGFAQVAVAWQVSLRQGCPARG